MSEFKQIITTNDIFTLTSILRRVLNHMAELNPGNIPEYSELRNDLTEILNRQESK